MYRERKSGAMWSGSPAVSSEILANFRISSSKTSPISVACARHPSHAERKTPRASPPRFGHL